MVSAGGLNASDQHPSQAGSGLSDSALVEDRLRRFLGDQAEIFGAIETRVEDVNDCADAITRAADLARRWPRLAPAKKRAVLSALVDRVDLLRETLEIRIMPGRLLSVLFEENDPREDRRTGGDSEPMLTFTVPARLKRVGMETRLLIDGAGGSPRGEPDHSLLRLLAQAYRYREMLLEAQGRTMSDLAREAGVGRPYFCRVVRLGFLAPDVVTAVLRDRHPLELTAKRLSRHTRLPNAWDDQVSALGIA